jgi:hypothetical protein
MAIGQLKTRQGHIGREEGGVLFNMWLSANYFQQSRNSNFAEKFLACTTNSELHEK